MPSDRKASAQTPVVLCDAVQSLGVHNGVTRIEFVRLNAGGEAIPAVELLVPNFVLSQLIRALQAVKA